MNTFLSDKVRIARSGKRLRLTTLFATACLSLCAIMCAAAFAPASAWAKTYEVSNWEQLDAALRDGGASEKTIVMLSDITLQGDVSPRWDELVTLDGKGHTLDLSGFSMDSGSGQLNLDSSEDLFTIVSSKPMHGSAYTSRAAEATLTSVYFKNINFTEAGMALIRYPATGTFSFAGKVEGCKGKSIFDFVGESSVTLAGYVLNCVVESDLISFYRCKDIILFNSLIEGNTCAETCLSIYECASASLVSTTLQNNNCDYVMRLRETEGLFTEHEGTPCLFKGNKSSNSSTVYVENSKVTLKSVEFCNNEVSNSNDCSALWCFGNSPLEITGAYIHDNTGGMGAINPNGAMTLGGTTRIENNLDGAGRPSDLILSLGDSHRLTKLSINDTFKVYVKLDGNTIPSNPEILFTGLKEAGPLLKLNRNLILQSYGATLRVNPENDDEVQVIRGEMTPPPAVEGVRATSVGYGYVRITWKTFAEAGYPTVQHDGYALFRKKGSNGSLEYVKECDSSALERPFYDRKADPDSYNYYFVRAFIQLNDGTRLYGPLGDYAYCRPNTPSIPQAPEAKRLDGSKVRLSWSASAGADGYVIYRKSGSGNFSYYKLVKYPYYIDTDTRPFVTNRYRVHAYRDAPNGRRLVSKASRTVTCTPMLPDVSFVKARLSGKNVVVSWGKSKGATHYAIFAKVDGVYRYKYVVPATSTRWVDTSPARGKTGFYFVRPAVKQNGKLKISPTTRYAWVVVPA